MQLPVDINYSERWYLDLLNYKSKFDIPSKAFYDIINIFILSRDKLIKGRTINLVLVASLYCGIKVHALPINSNDIINKTQIPLLKFRKTYRLIIKEILPQLELSVHQYTILDYINQFIIDLKLYAIKVIILKLTEKVHRNNLASSGKDPRGIAGAIIYICCRDSQMYYTEEEISKLAQVSEVTLRKRIKEIQKIIPVLF